MAGVTVQLLAPPPNIIRNTAGQAAFLPRLLEMAADLAVFSATAGERLDVALGPRFQTLATALLHSPHYSELLGRTGFGPLDLSNGWDLRHFPVLEREVLQRDPFALVRQDEGTEERLGLVALRSSGSSGQPVTVYKSRLDCLVMWGVLCFWLERFGIKIPPRPRSVLLCTLPSGLEYSVRVPVFQNGALHRISRQRPEAVERLRKARPFVLFTNPDGLLWFERQEAPPVPRLFLSSAQYLSPEVRNTVSRSFDVPVVNYYASTETGPIAWECLESAGRFHVLLPHVWVESIEGELLVTRLRPSPFLLLRYRIGDRGQVFRDDCDCGYRGLTITDFGGRCRTRFLTPDGQTVDPWKLAYLFKYQPVRAFQLTQTGGERFRLQIRAASGTPSASALVADLAEGLRRLGFPSPVIDVAVLGDELDSGPKFDPFAREEPAFSCPDGNIGT